MSVSVKVRMRTIARVNNDDPIYWIEIYILALRSLKCLPASSGLRNPCMQSVKWRIGRLRFVTPQFRHLSYPIRRHYLIAIHAAFIHDQVAEPGIVAQRRHKLTLHALLATIVFDPIAFGFSTHWHPNFSFKVACDVCSNALRQYGTQQSCLYAVVVKNRTGCR